MPLHSHCTRALTFQNTRQEDVTSQITTLDARVQNFDQKIDVVLRLLSKVASTADAPHPSDRKNASTNLEDPRTAALQQSDARNRSPLPSSDQVLVPNLWDGLVGALGTTNKRPERKPMLVPISAYLPVTYNEPTMTSKQQRRMLASAAARSDLLSDPLGDGAASQQGHRDTGQGILVKVPWRLIRRKFWKKPTEATKHKHCVGCADCRQGESRQGLILCDSTYVLLVVDHQLDSSSATAHELLGGGKDAQTPSQILSTALSSLKLSHLAYGVTKARSTTCAMSGSDHVARFHIASTKLPEALLDAASEVSFAEGCLISSALSGHPTPLPDRIPVDETTLVIIAKIPPL